MKMKSVLLSLAFLQPQVSAFGAFLSSGKEGKLLVSDIVDRRYSIETIPGAVAPLGIFDPLALGAKADEATLKRYREAEVTHGRVAMLAVVGVLAGEAVEGSSFLFDASIQGPAITHLAQVPSPFWVALGLLIAKYELDCAEIAFVRPEDIPVDQPGLLRAEHVPGDIGFDPLGIKPSNPVELETMMTKELQNGRLAMLAAAGFMAQELADGKGIIEHLTTSSSVQF